MVSWKGKKRAHYSDQVEFNIDNIDQSVFDDPILLLEYLEKQELQRKTNCVPNVSSNQRLHEHVSSNSSSIPYDHSSGSKALYGYDLVRGEIRVNQAEAEAVAYIISLHEKGYSYSQIEYLLGGTKHRTITGKKFYPAAIQAIVKNKKVYEGETGYPPILGKNSSLGSEPSSHVVDNQIKHEEKTTPTQTHLSSKNGNKTSAMYGYDIVNEAIQINEEEAAAIRTIFGLFNAGYSYTQISEKLRYSTHRTISGSKFYPAAVQAVIEKRKVYEGDTGYPPILKKKRIEDNKEERRKTEISTKKVTKDRDIAKERQIVAPQTKWTRVLTKEPEQRVSSSSVEHKLVYKSVDEFLAFVMSKGIPTKDNRWNDGCVWVKADPLIDGIVKQVIIKGRHFKYTNKCRAFEGQPGWYF